MQQAMSRRGGVKSGLLLSVGTFSALRVPPPQDVNTLAVRLSLMLAPVVGAGLSLVAGAVGWVGWWLAGRLDNRTMLVALVMGGLVVGALVWMTRGLHLDGLADLTDGLGSGRPAAGALEVMRDPRVGAFGAMALVLVLGLQAAALAVLIERGTVLPMMVAVGIAARAPLAWWARRGTPTDGGGLGRSVVGTFGAVSAAGLLAGWTVVAIGCAIWGMSLADGGTPGAGSDGGGAVLCGGSASQPMAVAVAVVAVGLGVGCAALLRRRAIRRLGALTGDTLGATIEVTATVMLVVLAVAG